MTAEGWIVLFATCFVTVSSNGEQLDYRKPCDQELCKTHKAEPELGSVLLPCNFSSSNNSTVTWKHNERVDVVQILSTGHIRFIEHRYGRVKVFPNQASLGVFSIRIDELTESDLGCYRCEQEDVCHQVVLLFIERSSQWADKYQLILICSSVAFVILLCAGVCCLLKKCTELCDDKTENGRNIPVDTIAGAVDTSVIPNPGSAPDHNFVYENDDQCPTNSDHTRDDSFPAGAVQDPAGPQPAHSSSGVYPNLNEFRFQRVESRRTQRFHIDLFTRLREASIRRHVYVNQDELNRQHAAAVQAEPNHRAGFEKKKKKKKQAKQKCEYNNPIYNRSTEHLDRL